MPFQCWPNIETAFGEWLHTTRALYNKYISTTTTNTHNPQPTSSTPQNPQPTSHDRPCAIPQRTHHLLSGGRGGGLEFLLLADFFFYLREKTILFFGDQRPTIFFYVSSKKFFVVCFPYYVRYIWCFFLVNIFFINFANKLFFSAHIFNKLFWRQTIFFNFFLGPPP